MSEPGHHDAVLMIQLAQWGTMLGLQNATAAIFADDFDPETAEAHDEAVRTVLMFGETVGTLTKNNLISEDLILDWLWIAGLWAKVGDAARRMREATGQLRMYENFEALALHSD